MKKIFLTALFLTILVGIAIAGINDRFADLELTDVTATADEINTLNGITSTAAELNILDGVTSTAAELNILDGVTSTAAELNILDGVTATTTEINTACDGILATATEINTACDGITATAAEINTVCDGVLTGTGTIDVASIAADASDSLTITVTGAVLGDFAIFSSGVDLVGLIGTCYVSASDTVTVNLENQTAGAIDLVSTTWKAKVFK